MTELLVQQYLCIRWYLRWFMRSSDQNQWQLIHGAVYLDELLDVWVWTHCNKSPAAGHCPCLLFYHSALKILTARVSMNIRWITMNSVCTLTARSCLTNMSDAFSEMFPTNTVVVGPPLSSVSLALMVPGSFFESIGFCATAIEVGTSTCNIRLREGGIWCYFYPEQE